MSSARHTNLRIVIASRRDLQRTNRMRELLMIAAGSMSVLLVACLVAAYLFQINVTDMIAQGRTLGRPGLALNSEGQPSAFAGVVPLPPAAPRPTRVVPTAAPARPVPTGLTVNGLAPESIVTLSAASKQRVREIFAKGQSLGRDPRAFSKVGDSTMAYPPFLVVFATNGDYQLGRFSYLQPTIDYYRGSLARTSAAVKKGMHTWTEFDPLWVASNECGAEEGPLPCELRLNNPSVMIIRLGANDVPEPASFSASLRKIVEFCLANGMIPILGTKPDRQEGSANTLNNIVKQTAAVYKIPLWDYDLVAGTVPGRGLEDDRIHMKGGGVRDYRSSAAFTSGDSLEDLTALMALDAVRKAIGQ